MKKMWIREKFEKPKKKIFARIIQFALVRVATHSGGRQLNPSEAKINDHEGGKWRDLPTGSREKVTIMVSC